MRKKVSKRNDAIIHIRAGQKVTFPVHAKHPLAKFQKRTPVRSTDDLYDFLVHWGQFEKANDRPTPTPKNLVARFAKSRIHIVRISSSLIRIDKGAVVTLNNPLNHLQADTIEIAGDLVSRGDLILNCTTLSIQ